MSLDQLAARAAEHLQRLCVDIPTRTVGSQGNRDATAYVSASLQTLGWEVETPCVPVHGLERVGRRPLCRGDILRGVRQPLHAARARQRAARRREDIAGSSRRQT